MMIEDELERGVEHSQKCWSNFGFRGTDRRTDRRNKHVVGTKLSSHTLQVLQQVANQRLEIKKRLYYGNSKNKDVQVSIL